MFIIIACICCVRVNPMLTGDGECGLSTTRWGKDVRNNDDDDDCCNVKSSKLKSFFPIPWPAFAV